MIFPVVCRKPVSNVTVASLGEFRVSFPYSVEVAEEYHSVAFVSVLDFR